MSLADSVRTRPHVNALLAWRVRAGRAGQPRPASCSPANFWRRHCSRRTRTAQRRGSPRSHVGRGRFGAAQSCRQTAHHHLGLHQQSVVLPRRARAMLTVYQRAQRLSRRRRPSGAVLLQLPHRNRPHRRPQPHLPLSRRLRKLNRKHRPTTLRRPSSRLDHGSTLRPLPDNKQPHHFPHPPRPKSQPSKMRPTSKKHRRRQRSLRRVLLVRLSNPCQHPPPRTRTPSLA
jgi:hypothetical protein